MCPGLHSTRDTRCRIPRAPLCLVWLSPKPSSELRSKPALPADSLQGTQPLFIVSRSCRSQTQRTPAAETVIPFFLSSLAARTCPHAGSSIANSTTAFSISSPIRFLRFGLLRDISCSAASPPVSYSSFKNYLGCSPSLDTLWTRCRAAFPAPTSRPSS